MSDVPFGFPPPDRPEDGHDEHDQSGPRAPKDDPPGTSGPGDHQDQPTGSGDNPAANEDAAAGEHPDTGDSTAASDRPGAGDTSRSDDGGEANRGANDTEAALGRAVDEAMSGSAADSPADRPTETQRSSGDDKTVDPTAGFGLPLGGASATGDLSALGDLGAMFGAGSGGGSPEDLAAKMPLFSELQKLMSWQGGPVNWDLARQSAISALTSSRTPGAVERSDTVEALHLAELWLDSVTDLPAGTTNQQAWSRAQWIEQTLPVWQKLCDPVASRVVAAMSSSMDQTLPPEARQQMGPLKGMMNSLGGMMFGAQVGNALGSMAGEVLGSTDIGLPLGPARTGILLPENVAAFSAGLDRPDGEIRLFLALREAAHHRLFSHVPWLRQRLLDAVDAYARGIAVDTSALEQAMGQIDPSDPESVQRALSGSMFEPQETPEQQRALRMLETLLALVEGWVDTVVAEAATGRLPGADALRETLRRRRAAGGPAEQTFATLVGLELRPRRLRDAATLYASLQERRGREARDAVWSHPDLLPTAADLDDPTHFGEDGGSLSMEDLDTP